MERFGKGFILVVGLEIEESRPLKFANEFFNVESKRGNRWIGVRCGNEV